METSTLKKTFFALAAFICLSLIAARMLVPAMVENGKNRVSPHDPYVISDEARALHQSLIIMDWHGDSLLWDRDLAKRSSYGHADLPRMREGNLGIQMFTTVTKAPAGLNIHQNDAQARDNITSLVIAQTWPMRTWGSLKARALYQSARLHELASAYPKQIRVLRNRQDLIEGLAAKANEPGLILALLGSEGGHPLEGEIEALDELYDAGFRMIGLQHFFDNELGGSLHGISKSGLSPFGRQVVQQMNKKGIIIDVSHSSEQVVKEVLELSTKPLVVSHTGLKGYCNSERNIADSLMQNIAKKGGLIAIGFWKEAICDDSPSGIARSIKYGITLLGEDHIALGSDFDGAISTSFDVSELAVLTQALMDQGLNQRQIKKVMGENSLRFLMQQLPEA